MEPMISTSASSLNTSPLKAETDIGGFDSEPRAQLIVKLTQLALSAPYIPSAVRLAL